MLALDPNAPLASVGFAVAQRGIHFEVLQGNPFVYEHGINPAVRDWAICTETYSGRYDTAKKAAAQSDSVLCGGR